MMVRERDREEAERREEVEREELQGKRDGENVTL